MGVVIEICIKYPGGPTRMGVTDVLADPNNNSNARTVRYRIPYVRMTRYCTCTLYDINRRAPPNTKVTTILYAYTGYLI
jgi:hypothetical protein